MRLSELDVQMLRRTLLLAQSGRGSVEPNPMVACVIARGDRVIGEGHHARYGGPHAEPTALAALTESPRGATAYVTLEPCCHTNKQTPPCAPRLIEAGIARVVIGCLDPNPDVNGKGVAMLRNAGIVVETAEGSLADEFRQLIAPFTLGQTKKRPYVTLKWAQTADGRVAAAGKKPVRITGPESDALVQRLRGRCDAIGVVVNTVLTDDPLLTARDPAAVRRPIKLVFDRTLRTPASARLFQGRQTPAIVLCDTAAVRDTARVLALSEAGATVEASNSETGLLSGPTFTALAGRHLLIEPGPTLAAAFLPWADRLWVFHALSPLENPADAPSAALVPDYYRETGSCRVGGDTLIEYLNTRSDSFVTASPSADFPTESPLSSQR